MAFGMPFHLWADRNALTKSSSFLELEVPFRSVFVTPVSLHSRDAQDMSFL